MPLPTPWSVADAHESPTGLAANSLGRSTSRGIANWPHRPPQVWRHDALAEAPPAGGGRSKRSGWAPCGAHPGSVFGAESGGGSAVERLDRAPRRLARRRRRRAALAEQTADTLPALPRDEFAAGSRGIRDDRGRVGARHDLQTIEHDAHRNGAAAADRRPDDRVRRAQDDVEHEVI